MTKSKYGRLVVDRCSYRLSNENLLFLLAFITNTMWSVHRTFAYSRSTRNWFGYVYFVTSREFSNGRCESLMRLRACRLLGWCDGWRLWWLRLRPLKHQYKCSVYETACKFKVKCTRLALLTSLHTRATNALRRIASTSTTADGQWLISAFPGISAIS